MRLYLILILDVLLVLGQATNLYQQQQKLIQPSQAEAMLAQSSTNAAVLSSQASSTAQAASIAAATTASLASALTGNGVLSSYPYGQFSSDSLLDWNQFALLSWELNSNANFDLWASKQFNNAWIGDLGYTSPLQLQFPSWVDSSSQSQWNVWAQILSAQRNALNAQAQVASAWNLQNGGLSSNVNGLVTSGLLSSGLSNANSLLGAGLVSTNGLLGAGLSSGNGLLSPSVSNSNAALLASSIANANGLLSSTWSPLSNGNTYGFNGVLVGPQPTGSGPWSGHYTGWNQNNGVWYGDNGAGWWQDSNGDWYVMKNYAINSGSINGIYVGPQPSGSGPWNGQVTGWTQKNNWWYNNNGVGWYQDNSGNWYTSQSNYNNANAGSGYYVGPQPSGSGPWNGQVTGWTQKNNWWYNNNGVGWYQDNSGNWYTSSNNYNNGKSGSGYYVGPQPSGSGPWNGQYNGWTQKNDRWYNGNGVGWYQDNSGNWYTSNSNYNNGYTGSGYYVGPQPSGSGPWSGQYNGWTQKDNWWYNNNGIGWYQDKSGNWYTSNNNYNNGYSGSGYYVGPQPSGSGPWNGQYNGWTQKNNWWYNNNGVGWYQDNSGNWYTSNNNYNNGYSGSGYYVGPQPSGSGPWNGQYNGWTQKNNWWYNSNGVGWYQDNSGNWYTSNSNYNNGYTGSGYYVGPQPSGSGPWNGQYNGWTQKNNLWYNSNGVGWYQDNSGNWYTSSNNYYSNGYGTNGNGIYVGPQPTGMGPWNGQYTGWTQRNGMWYNSNGVGWYQDSNGNWYTTSSMNQVMGVGEGQGQSAGTITSTQCVSTTVGQMNATLSCTPGSVIVSVLGAAYGNSPGSCPSNVNTMNPTCTLNITQLIQKTCQGQNQCSVTVQPNILGAPTNNGQQCSTSNTGPYATTNQYTMVARYTCGIAGPGGVGVGLNSTSLTFTPPNSASTSSYMLTVVLASLLVALLNIL